MQLAISTGSWHCRYYEMLRKIWGMASEKKDCSLCGYSQFIIWISVVTFFISPVIFLGWITLKISRFSYKQMNKTRFTRKIINFLDNTLQYGSFLETRSDKMEESPVLSCIFLGSVAIFCSVVAFVIVYIFSMGIYHFILFIPKLPFIVVLILLHIGWGFFKFLGFLGFILVFMGLGLKIAFIYFLLYFPWMIILSVGLKIIGIAILIAIIAFPIVYGVYRFFISPKTKKIGKWFLFKYNGFQKVRQKIKEEEKEEKQKRVFKKSSKNNLPDLLKKFFLKIFKSIITFFEIKKEHKVKIRGKERTVNIMGTFSLIWNIMKSIKNGVCPFIEFVDEKDISEEDVKNK